MQFAKNYVGARQYAWEQIDQLRQRETNQNKLRILNNYFNEFYPKAELVIIQDFFNPAQRSFDIAYKFNIYAGDPLTRGYVFVNAHTGKIMYYDKIIKHLSPDFKTKVDAPKLIPEAAFVISLSAYDA